MNSNPTYQIAPMREAFCAEVLGVDLSSLLSSSVAQQIVFLLSRHQLLLFREQGLDAERQVKLSKLLGRVETHRFHAGQLVDYPEIFRISNSAGDGHNFVGQYWHSDGLAFPTPTHVVILNVVEAPSDGGETLFIDAHRAWNLLSPNLLEKIREKRWKHSSGLWQQFSRAHFLSGRHALLINLGRIIEIEGLNCTAATSLIEEIDNYLAKCCRCYRHRWKEGDVIVMDNWSILHRAQPAPITSKRVVHRSSVLELHPFLSNMSRYC